MLVRKFTVYFKGGEKINYEVRKEEDKTYLYNLDNPTFREEYNDMYESDRLTLTDGRIVNNFFDTGETAVNIIGDRPMRLHVCNMSGENLTEMVPKSKDIQYPLMISNGQLFIQTSKYFRPFKIIIYNDHIKVCTTNKIITNVVEGGIEFLIK